VTFSEPIFMKIIMLNSITCVYLKCWISPRW